MGLNNTRKTKVLEKLVKLTASGGIKWKSIGNIETYVAPLADTLLVLQHTPSNSPLLAIGPVFFESVMHIRHKQLLDELSTMVRKIGHPFITEEMQDDVWELLEAGCLYLESKNSLTSVEGDKPNELAP